MQSHRETILPPEDNSVSAQAHADPASTPARPHQSFAADTPIQTRDGVQRVDALAVGDRVLTRSGEYAQIEHIDRIHLSRQQLLDAPEIAPIRFDPGALPGMSDGPAMLLSPDLPIEWTPEPNTTTSHPARAFCDGGLIRCVIPDEGIDYIRLHFKQAQRLCVGGLWVELDRTKRHGRARPVPAPTLVHDTRVFRPLLG